MCSETSKMCLRLLLVLIVVFVESFNVIAQEDLLFPFLSNDQTYIANGNGKIVYDKDIYERPNAHISEFPMSLLLQEEKSTATKSKNAIGFISN